MVGHGVSLRQVVCRVELGRSTEGRRNVHSMGWSGRQGELWVRCLLPRLSDPLICSPMPQSDPSRVDIVLVHSSDLHVDDEASATKHQDGTAGLAAVLAAAKAHNADIVLLAGDTFDNNRVPVTVLDRVGRLL